MVWKVNIIVKETEYCYKIRETIVGSKVEKQVLEL